jgi:hypothetical protein
LANGYSCYVKLERTLKKTVAALERQRVPYLLGGSLACWARGAPPFAADLDFMVKPVDAERALGALVDAGMREERPPEQWLLKAWDDDALVDLIFAPSGMEITDEVISRGERLSVAGMWIQVMALEDVLTTMLMALGEHSLDYERAVQVSRSLRERIDWSQVRARTQDSPYARTFFILLEELDIVPPAELRDATRPRVRVA